MWVNAEVKELEVGSKKSYETLKRQWLILNRMPHHGKKGSKYFQDAVNEMGLDVSLRTIQRDLDGLSRVFPLVSDGERITGWKWSEDAAVFDIPGMDPHAALAFKMIDLHLGDLLPESCLNFLKPYGKRADKVLTQLENGGVARWPQKIARISRHLTLEPPKIDRTVLSTVYDGLLLENQIEITYQNHAGTKTQQAQIHPLGLVFVDNIAYLVCTFWNYEDPRQVALHRIKSAKSLDESANIPTNFKLAEYIDAGNFFYPQGGTMQLKCRFDPKVAKYLEESPFNQTQKLETESDGQVLLTAVIEDTDQLRWWLLSFGDQVEIVAPPELRQQMKETCRNMALLYEEDA